MLVLTRRPGQEVILTTPDGEHIVIQVCAVRAGQVRLGVAAPPPFSIARAELCPLPVSPVEPSGHNADVRREDLIWCGDETASGRPARSDDSS